MKKVLSIILVIIICVSIVPQVAYAASWKAVQPPTNGSVIIGKGHTTSGGYVVWLQEKLNNLEFNCGTVDGYWGTNTDKGIRAYQSARGLTVDGLAGKSTLTKLVNDASNPSSSTLKITGYNYPSNLDSGQSFPISGTVSSNYKITEVTIQVQHVETGTVTTIHTVKPNTVTYSIKDMDTKIKFGLSKVGKNIYTIKATDASGNTVTKSHAFTVLKTGYSGYSGYTRAQLAQQILNDSTKINFTYNVLAASTKQQLVDTAAGKTVKAGDGKEIYLSKDLLISILLLRDKYGSVGINALANGTHRVGSYHYKGQAVDIHNIGSDTVSQSGNTYDVAKTQYLKSEGFIIGDFSGNVCREKNHFHYAIIGHQ